MKNYFQKSLHKRGFLLITSLLICIVMLLIGMGMVGGEASRYRAAMRNSESVQARQLALAGLEDARIKMELDINFPPPPETGPAGTSGSVYSAGPDDTQPLFTYSESITIPGLTPVTGSYMVTIDSTNCTPRFWDDDVIKSFNVAGTRRQVILVTSVGTIGTATQTTSQYSITAELDVSLYKRTSPYNVANPNYFHFTHIEDANIP